MKKLLHLIDPYHQSFLYFKWGFWRLLFSIVAFSWLLVHARGSFVNAVLHNMLIYMPNYLIQEFSQRIWCTFSSAQWCYVSGYFTEMLIPFLLCLLLLRLRGGRYILPFITYWLATALYDVGIYAADARAGKLPLVSDDMLTVYAPGTTKGDWHHFLDSMGWLENDMIIGQIFIFAAVFLLLLSFYSLIYYWRHHSQYVKNGHWR